MSLHDSVKSSYLGLKRALSDNRPLEYKWFVEQEVDTWDHWVSMPLRRRLWLWRHGFPSFSERLYDLDAHGPDAYLSELGRYRLYNALNGRHRYLVDDKLSQHWMLSDYPDNRPTAYGLVEGGRIHASTGTVFDGEPVPVSAWLPGALPEHAPLVVKKLRSKGGADVLVCDVDDEDGFLLDGDPTTERALCETVAELSGYLVMEYVDQHAYADELYSHAANTIRLLTLWDDETEELFVPVAVQRIGTDRSRPVDNCSAGGLTAEIDLDTGELGPATQYPYWSDEMPWYDEHPDTGAPIRGERIPEWERVLSTVRQIALDNTNIPAIGWDVILDESGVPVVIEANTGTGAKAFQVHRPLLADPRVRRLAARHLPDVDPPAAPVAADESDAPVREASSAPPSSR